MKTYRIVGVFFICILTSCADFLERYPLESPSSETFYSNRDELLLAINACYGAVTFNSFEWTLDLTTDIAWQRLAGGKGEQSVGNGSHSSQTNIFADAWRSYYQCIGRCNFLLIHMVRAKEVVGSDLYERIAAEARFLRAFCYLRLVTLYGDVPLVIEELPIDKVKVKRTSVEEVYSFVYKELDAASDVLPVEYSSADVGRITKGAAWALKARAALYQGKYDVAILAAKKVMDLGFYELHPDYRQLFTYAGEESKEIIFSYGYQYGTRQHALTLDLMPKMNRGGGVGWTVRIPTWGMVDSYECIDGKPIYESTLYNKEKPFDNRDPRLDQSIIRPGALWTCYIYQSHPDSTKIVNLDTGITIENTDATGAYASYTGFCWKKFLDEEDLPHREKSILNNIMIRYAEVLLTYAEAKIELGEIDQSVYDAINQIRMRPSVKMPPITPQNTPDQASLRKQVRRERKVELAFEGHRLFDLRRWKIAEKALNCTLYGKPMLGEKYAGIPVFDENDIPNYDAYKGILRVVETRLFDPSRDYLWPIPQSERDANPELTQNPKY